MIQETTRVVDVTTGELLTEKIKNVRKVRGDEFIQVYLRDLSGLLEVTSKKELTILAMLWKYSTYTDEDNLGNRVSINVVMRQEIKETTNITEGAFRNALSKFVKKQLIFKHPAGRGTYYLNPVYFFKGYSHLRNKTIQYVLEYKLEE